VTRTTERAARLCALALALAASAAPAGSGDTEGTEAAHAAARRWLEAYSGSLNKGDLAAFAGLWADDADWVPPDAPMLSGRQAILGVARATFDTYTVRHRYTTRALKVVGGFGVATVAGTETHTPRDGSGAAREQRVRGVVLLRQSEDGSFAATHFVWNCDSAPCGPLPGQRSPSR
jgi:uncharacterized protein (TIGR02246 family)